MHFFKVLKNRPPESGLKRVGDDEEFSSFNSSQDPNSSL